MTEHDQNMLCLSTSFLVHCCIIPSFCIDPIYPIIFLLRCWRIPGYDLDHYLDCWKRQLLPLTFLNFVSCIKHASLVRAVPLPLNLFYSFFFMQTSKPYERIESLSFSSNHTVNKSSPVRNILMPKTHSIVLAIFPFYSPNSLAYLPRSVTIHSLNNERAFHTLVSHSFLLWKEREEGYVYSSTMLMETRKCCPCFVFVCPSFFSKMDTQ